MAERVGFAATLPAGGRLAPWAGRVRRSRGFAATLPKRIELADRVGFAPTLPKRIELAERVGSAATLPKRIELAERVGSAATLPAGGRLAPWAGRVRRSRGSAAPGGRACRDPRS